MISAMQAYYTRYIEKDIIFTGKRRTFASRVRPPLPLLPLPH